MKNPLYWLKLHLSGQIHVKIRTEKNTEGDYCNKVELPITKHYLIMEYLPYFFGFLSLRFSWPGCTKSMYKTSLNSKHEIVTTKCKKRTGCQKRKKQ
jgi:hypothetical protein